MRGLGDQILRQITLLVFVLMLFLSLVLSYLNYNVVQEHLEDWALGQLLLNSQISASQASPWNSSRANEVGAKEGYSEEILSLSSQNKSFVSGAVYDVKGGLLSQKTISVGTFDFEPSRSTGSYGSHFFQKKGSKEWSEVEHKEIDYSQSLMVVKHSLLHQTFEVVEVFRFQSPHIRRRAILLTNLFLGVLFILTALVSVRIWAQQAIQRPLASLKSTLDELQKSMTLETSFLENNELMQIAQRLNQLVLDQVSQQVHLKKSTEELEIANQKYRDLNENLEVQVEEKTRDMKEFFSLVTHDLRIPLSAVQGYQDLLLRDKHNTLSEQQKVFIERSRQANSHALALVRNLLDAMRYEFSDVPVIGQEFYLDTLVQEVIDRFGSLEKMSDRCILVKEGEDFEVSLDLEKIKRVFQNLCANAIDHGGEEVKVTVFLEDRKEQGVFCRVRDDGVGIDEALIKKIFDKFHSSSSPDTQGESTKVGSGFGLGLFIVHRILGDHGVSIEVQSSPGEGTAFQFLLPRSLGNNAKKA